MKLSVLVVACAVFGISIGALATVAEFATAVNQFEPSNRIATRSEPEYVPVDGTGATDPPVGEVKLPKFVLVNGNEFDFGTLDRNARGSHTFIVRNDGNKNLQFKLQSVTCGLCIESDFHEAELAPGETGEVTLEYVTRKDLPEFNEGAELITSDPQNTHISLRIRGFVTQNVVIVPTTVVFQNISTHQSHERSVNVFAYRSKDVQIEDHTFTNADLADFFGLSWSPLTTEQLALQDRAIGGVELRIKAKAGLPFGTFNQNLRLSTNIENDATLEVPIHGRVVSDISIIGPGYDSERNRLLVGLVKQGVGAERAILLSTKGPHRETTKFTIEKVTPDNGLDVSLGDATTQNDGAVYVTRIRIRIRDDAPEMNFMGDRPEGLGQIVIRTTHPEVPELILFVKFAVQE